jgi:hypothetical protein
MQKHYVSLPAAWHGAPQWRLGEAARLWGHPEGASRGNWGRLAIRPGQAVVGSPDETSGPHRLCGVSLGRSSRQEPCTTPVQLELAGRWAGGVARCGSSASCPYVCPGRCTYDTFLAAGGIL